jgi:uncharacterized protein
MILKAYKVLGGKRRMSFNSMLHKDNKSRKAIKDFFVKLTGDQFVPIGEGTFIDAYDEGGKASSLIMSEEEHRKIREELFYEFDQGVQVNFMVVRDKVRDFMWSIRSHRPAEAIGQKCGMDSPYHIAVDLQGNVLTCQNESSVSIAPNGNSHKIGHVDNIEQVKLNTATHWSFRDECLKCPVLQLCKGACMFLEGDLFKISCDNMYDDNMAFFALAFRHLTSHIPIRIDGPLEEKRKQIFNDRQVI